MENLQRLTQNYKSFKCVADSDEIASLVFIFSGMDAALTNTHTQSSGNFKIHGQLLLFVYINVTMKLFELIH